MKTSTVSSVSTGVGKAEALEMATRPVRPTMRMESFIVEYWRAVDVDIDGDEGALRAREERLSRRGQNLFISWRARSVVKVRIEAGT